MRSPKKHSPPSRAFSDRWKTVGLALALFIGTVWTFSPALRNGFVDYDDADYVTQNLHVQRGLTWDNVRWAFTDTQQAGFWHPLTWLSHMLDCQMFGLDAGKHHLVSVLIHALNAVLLFLLFRQLTQTTWRSWLLAALFAVHPLRVESVAWAAERKDVLSAFFCFLTLLAYARYAKSKVEGREPRAKKALDYRPSTLDYFAALFFFTCGLMCKPMLVTLPFALLLLDYWPLGRVQGSGFKVQSWGKLVLEKVPFFVLAFAGAAVAFWTQHASRATSVGVPFSARAENAVVSYGRYLGKFFYPEKLTFFYPHPGFWPIWIVVVCAVLLAVVTVAAVKFGRSFPWLPVGWFWFLGTLLPVLGLVQVGAQAMADRFTYIPAIGLLIIVIWGAHEIGRRWRCAPMMSSIGAAAGIVCLVLTRQQVGYWKDDETLCRHALAVTENNYLAHFVRGVGLEKTHQPDKAVEEYRATLAAQPNYVVAHNNLGFALANEGRLDDAMAEFQEALKAEADPPRTHLGMGVILGREGKLDGAIREFEQAAKLQPDWPEAYFNLGIAYQHAGDFTNAATAFENALGLRPDSVEYRVDLANSLARAGRLDEAIARFREAAAQQPQIAEIHNNLGLALAMRGDRDEATREFQEALRLKPDYADAQKNLADLASTPSSTGPPSH